MSETKTKQPYVGLGPAVLPGASVPLLARSFLFMPGSNERALGKITSLDADAFIIDWEDAVAESAKADARDKTCAYLQNLAQAGAAEEGCAYTHRPIYVRVNGVDTPHFMNDVAALTQAPLVGLAGVVLPKVESAGALQACAQAFAEAGYLAPMWAMIESPAALFALSEIVSAGVPLVGLIAGTNDMTADLGAEHVPGRSPLLYSLSATVAAARAGGVLVLDGVYNAVQDAEGFQVECQQGRAMGFDGKTLIHPSQIAPANAAFGPAEAAVAEARALKAAYSEALAAGKGAVAFQGKMIEALHVRAADKLIAMADEISRR